MIRNMQTLIKLLFICVCSQRRADDYLKMLQKTSALKDAGKIKVHDSRYLSTRKILYSVLFMLLCIQIITLFMGHSLTGHLTLCDTIFILLINAEEGPFIGSWLKKNSSSLKTPVAHVIACVTIQALIFVVFTHSMETLFCDEPGAHFTDMFLSITLIGLSFKISVMIYFRIQMISAKQQCILHLLAPAGVVVLYLKNKLYISVDDSYYLSRLDPLLAMILCLIITGIVLPLFFHHIPSLLCHSPPGIEIDKFRTEIENNFPNTRCLHLHVYNTYPTDEFGVIMHVAIGIETSVGNLSTRTKELSNGDWVANLSPADVSSQVTRVEEILAELRSVLCKAGARNVTIEPHFISVLQEKCSTERLPNSSWIACKTAACSESKGCCSITTVNTAKKS